MRATRRPAGPGSAAAGHAGPRTASGVCAFIATIDPRCEATVEEAAAARARASPFDFSFFSFRRCRPLQTAAVLARRPEPHSVVSRTTTTTPTANSHFQARAGRVRSSDLAITQRLPRERPSPTRWFSTRLAAAGCPEPHTPTVQQESLRGHWGFPNSAMPPDPAPDRREWPNPLPFPPSFPPFPPCVPLCLEKQARSHNAAPHPAQTHTPGLD